MGLEYLDHRETMDALGVTEDDLKELVASGRLRAYVDDNQTRFLRGDVETAKVIKKSLKVRTARRVRNPKTQTLERPASPAPGADGAISEIFDPDSLTGESVFEDADLSREDEAEIARILSRTERPSAQPSKPLSYEFKKKLKERSKQEILESGERDRPAPPRPKKGKKVSEPRHVTVRPEESRSEDDWLPPPRERGKRKDEKKERGKSGAEAPKAGKIQKKEKDKEKTKEKKPAPKPLPPESDSGDSVIPASESGEAPAPAPARPRGQPAPGVSPGRPGTARKERAPSRGGGLPERLDDAATAASREFSAARKALVALGILAVFGGVFAYNLAAGGFSIFQDEERKKVLYEEVRRGDIVQVVGSQGLVVPKDRAQVRPSIRGEVGGENRGVLVRVGQEVKRGDPVIELLAPDLDHEVKVAETGLDLAGKSLEELQTKLANAIRELDTQRADLDRQKAEALRKVGEAELDVKQVEIEIRGLESRKRDADEQYRKMQVPPVVATKYEIDQAKEKCENFAIELEKAQGRLTSAQARVESLRAAAEEAGSLHRYEAEIEILEVSIRKAESQIGEAQANLDRARAKLADKTVRSPIAGIVEKVEVREGDQVDPTTVLLEVVDRSAIYLEAEVEENEIFRVQVGQKAKVKIEAFPDDDFHGEVEEIAKEGKRRGAGSDVSVFPTRIRIEEPADLVKSLLPGMTGSTEITTRVEENVLLVPQQAVVRRPKKPGEPDSPKESVVFVLKSASDGHEVLAQEVLTGELDEIHIQITSGLRGGEKVVVGPLELLGKLRTGMPVDAEKAK